MTATTTRPGQTAPALIWTKVGGNGVRLGNGKPMTGRQATEYVRRNWTNFGARITDAGDLEVRNLNSGDTGTWVGALPVPADPHAAIGDLILDMPLSVKQGDLLTKALEAAADSSCPDCPVCAPLLQLLATAGQVGR